MTIENIFLRKYGIFMLNCKDVFRVIDISNLAGVNYNYASKMRKKLLNMGIIVANNTYFDKTYMLTTKGNELKIHFNKIKEGLKNAL